MHDETSRASEQEPEEGGAAPLARRDPGVARDGDHEDDREIGRVEKMLSVEPEEELAADRRRGRERGDQSRPGSQEKA